MLEKTSRGAVEPFTEQKESSVTVSRVISGALLWPIREAVAGTGRCG